MWVIAVPGASGADSVEPRSIPSGTVVMSLPASAGELQRPPVELNHKAHTDALATEGCTVCHELGDKGLAPVLTAAAGLEDRDDLIDAYHGACIGCHKRRASSGLSGGPVTCGECHVRRAPGVSQRQPIFFDYSLHGRHSLAFNDKCESCHHVFDDRDQTLKYEKGKEDACHSCHGPVDQEHTLSVANASHRSCVSCHLKRAAEQLATGPVLCAGCHDQAKQEMIKKLDEIPRLVRGQPDAAWIVTSDARSGAVAFDHKRHEPATSSCSTCHHQSLSKCSQCHSLTGTEQGRGVTMANAYHRAPSERSCVGCHARTSWAKTCAGCHLALGTPPAERACVVCHAGPSGTSASDIPVPKPTAVTLAALPATGDGFPETVVIESLVDRFESSRLPHKKIAVRLDGVVRESVLAASFHGTTETLCAGCHHHSPVGTRPPPCRSCHGAAADATTDKPGLKVAYHRQCVGCHQKMGIPQQGCTDCHAAREVTE
jgi:hypothetical protein